VSARTCGAHKQVYSPGPTTASIVEHLLHCPRLQRRRTRPRAHICTYAAGAATHLTVFLACAAAFFASLRCFTFCSPRMAPHDDELSAAQLSLTGDAPGQT